MTPPTVDLTGSMAENLHEVLRVAAQNGPLATDDMTGATVVLRQRDLETLAHDPRLNGIGMSVFDMMGIVDGPLRDWYSRLMFTTEGDYHQRIRSLVSRSFTPRAVEALRPVADAMATAAVDSVRDGGDLAAACSTLATRLTCSLLGVPDTDVEKFAQWAEDLSPVFYVMAPEQVEHATKAIIGLRSYVDELARRRLQNPGPDLISGLLAAESDGQRLTREETVDMVANLLVAGHDTTGSQILCSILVALQHRDELTGIHQDEALLASAVAETMRLEPSVPAIPRTAIAPIELHDTTVEAGTMVLLCIAAACRDASAWRDPDDFDPYRFTRPDVPRLLNFGAGTHYCLGAALAKLAVTSCIRSVLATVAPLHLVEDPTAIPWRRVLGRSPARLVVNSRQPRQGISA